MISRTSANKIAVLSLIATAAMLVGTKAMAANSTNVRMEQKSMLELYGKWTLTAPANSSVYTGNSSTAIRDVSVHIDGTYILDIDAPDNAITTVSVYEDGTRKSYDVGTKHSIEMMTASDYRVIIEYAYDGTITVDSQPEGAAFDLVSPYDITFSGVTPAVFHRLPAQYFTVRYRDMDGCRSPKPQKRVTDNTIHFYGNYDCSPIVKEEKKDPFVDTTRGSVDISLTPNQSEIVAGGNVYYTIEVENFSKRSQNDLQVSFQFDEEHMKVLEILPQKGSLINDKTIAWNVDKVLAGKSWKTTFPVHVLGETTQGTILAANSRVSGPEVRKVASVSLQSSTNVGVAILPATGMRFDTLFLLMSVLAAFGLSYTAKKNRTK